VKTASTIIYISPCTNSLMNCGAAAPNPTTSSIPGSPQTASGKSPPPHSPTASWRKLPAARSVPTRKRYGTGVPCAP
jgi:hypothetical protein